jgi:hypothetical protein
MIMSEVQRRLASRRKEIDAKNEAASPSDPDNQDQGLHLNQEEWDALDRLDGLDAPADPTGPSPA